MTSSVFNAPLVHREHFDPANEQHLMSFRHFIRTGNWGKIQFFPELPYNEVPMTVLMKFAEHETNVYRESSADRAHRIAAIPDIVRFDLHRLNPSQDRAKRQLELQVINKKIFAKDDVNANS